MFTGLIEEIGTVRRIERGAKGRAADDCGEIPCSKIQKSVTALPRTAYA